MARSRPFRVLAPARQEQRRILNAYRNSWNAFGLLYRSDKKVRKNDIPIEIPSTTSIERQPQHRSNDTFLDSLPGEIISMILEDPVLTEYDIIAFGLCSQTAWAYAINHIRRDVRTGRWANTPLVCIQPHTDPNVPEAICMLDPQTVADVKTWNAIPNSVDKPQHPCHKWYGYAKDNFLTVETLDSPTTWMDAFKSASHRSLHDKVTLVHLRRNLSELLDTSYSNIPGQCYLRNLDKRELVLLEHVLRATDAEDVFYVKGEPWLLLDTAVMLRIALAKIGRNLAQLRKPNAVWAGDRLDVVAADEDMVISEGWKDVTDQIIQEWKEFESESD